MDEVSVLVLKGRYKLHRLLARGGMSAVYAAEDLVLERPVAVKLLLPEYVNDPTLVERLLREAKAAARLNHPNIIAIHDCDGKDDHPFMPFIAMEYVDGKNLAQVLREGGALPPAKAVQVATDTATALGFAHRNGIVHRDVKPANIMLTSDGVVKVADFGILKAIHSRDPRLTRTGTVMGTVAYMSPEQVQGYDVGPSSDMYSLGCVLFEMLTGGPLFGGDTPVGLAYKQVHDVPVAPSSINPAVPEHLDAVVIKCLSKQPNDRYRDANELLAALRPFQAGVAPGERPQPTVAMPPSMAASLSSSPAGVVSPSPPPPPVPVQAQAAAQAPPPPPPSPPGPAQVPDPPAPPVAANVASVPNVQNPPDLVTINNRSKSPGSSRPASAASPSTSSERSGSELRLVRTAELGLVAMIASAAILLVALKAGTSLFALGALLGLAAGITGTLAYARMQAHGYRLPGRLGGR